jgi:MFS family permease
MESERSRARVPASTFVLAILCAMSFVMYIDRTNISTAMLSIRSDLHLSNAQSGLVFSAFAVTYACGMIPGGWIGDRLGAHRMLTVCGLFWALGTLLTGFAGGMASLMAARLLVGLGESPIVPASARAMSTWVATDRRGFAQGITHACARLGNASTPLLVAALTTALSWRFAFFALGVLSLAWVALWVWYYRDDPARHPGMTSADLARLPADLGSRRPRMRWRPLLRTLWPATLVSFCHGWVLWFFLNWMPSYFSQAYHMNIKHSALFSSGIFLSGVVGTTLGGYLSDVVLRRTGDIRRARRAVITFGFLAPVVFVIPLMAGNLGASVAAGCLAATLFLSELVTAPLWALSMDLAPFHAGTAGGVMNTGLGIAAAVSPPIVGWLLDAGASWHAVFGMSMGFLVLGPIAARLVRPDTPYLGEPQPDTQGGPAVVAAMGSSRIGA